MSSKRGFSLVELMIVVAIIGILAAIAVPNFRSMQLKSKRTEIPANLDGIKTAQMAFEASNDEYLDLSPAPVGNPSRTPVTWAAADTDWDRLGWVPDGQVRGLYQTLGISNEDFELEGRSDVDGDGNEAIYTATVSMNPTIASTDLDKY